MVALEEFTPVIYAELHRIAKLYMNRERNGHITVMREW